VVEDADSAEACIKFARELSSAWGGFDGANGRQHREALIIVDRSADPAIRRKLQTVSGVGGRFLVTIVEAPRGPFDFARNIERAFEADPRLAQLGFADALAAGTADLDFFATEALRGDSSEFIRLEGRDPIPVAGLPLRLHVIDLILKVVRSVALKSARDLSGGLMRLFKGREAARQAA